MNKNYSCFLICVLLMIIGKLSAQTTYGAAASYSLRKTVPSYTGSAIQVRRTCDNATKDIGFTSCGDLDQTSLQKFVLAANPISAITSPVDAVYSLRRMKCGYSGNAVNVRRGCDNATTNIGFTTNGDLDTTALKTFVIASNPLSALSTTASAAYSLRKLSCTYAGSAIRVRRSSDNATQDIGFTALGDLDTAALKTFVGSGNGFVTTWYDQSGNANHALQATTANQPQIISSGLVIRQNGKPAVSFDGTSSYLSVTYGSSMDYSSASTTNCVFAKTGTPTGDAAIFDQQYTSNNISVALSWNNNTGAYAPLSLGYYPTAVGSWQYAALGTDVSTSSDYIISGTILSGAANTTSINLYQNGTLSASATNKATVGAQAAVNFNIGKRWDLGNYAPMYMQELITFKTVLSTTDRQYLEYGQSLYYSIAGPSNITTFPASAPGAYITKVYDQSGNGYDISQATTASQPRIVNAGAIDRALGNAAVYFDGVDDYMSNSAYNLYLNSQTPTWNAVVYPVATNNAYSPIVSWRVGGGVCSQLEVGGNNNWNICWWSNNTNWTTTNGTSVSNSAYQILTSLTQATANQVYFNGSLSYNNTGQSNAAATSSYSTTPLYVGYDNGFAGRYIKGYLNEIVLSSTNLSATDRQYLEWSQAQYYGISGPTLSTPPANAPSGYVAKWYDQSGNGVTLSQTTTSSQPIIMNTGVVQTLNGLPSLVSSHSLATSIYGTFSSAYTGTKLSAATVFQSDTSTTGNLRVMSLGTGTATADWSNASYFNVNQRSGLALVIERNGIFGSAAISLSSALALSVVFDGTNNQVFGNGLGSVSSGDTRSFNFTTLMLLKSINPGFQESMKGRMSEYSLFQLALNTTRRTLIENNEAAYYGLTITNSKYTASSGYTYFVTGVGRTSSTDSVADSRQSGGMGFISGITATDYLKDNGDYMVAGMSCPTAAVTTSLYMPTGATATYERWLNDWYLNKTDVSSNGGNIQLFFDFSDYGVSGVPANVANYQLWGRANTTSNFTVVPTTATAISGDRVVFTLPAANLGATGYYTLGSVDYINSPLPIDLVSFTAKANGSKTDIAWQTATETNNHFFTVERSADGVDFAELCRQNSKAPSGNSKKTLLYNATDDAPLAGVSYYRLKQTDYNSNYKRFNVVSVVFDESRKVAFTVFPNPNKGEFFIDFSGIENNHEVELILYDANGRKVYNDVFYSASLGTNHINIIPLRPLEKGAYVCTIIFEGISRSVTMIVD